MKSAKPTGTTISNATRFCRGKLRLPTALIMLSLSSCATDQGSPDNDIGATYFSPDYLTARSRFREGAQKTGGRLTSMELDAKGPAGEDLTIDIAWFGSEQPCEVLLHSSGLHGVEAFAGSAIQLQLLDQGLPVIPEDSAFVLVHVINPYGMAWLRRFNENNVDLNRNFAEREEDYKGSPPMYPELDPFLNPKTPPSGDFFYLKAGWLLVRHGMSKLKGDVTYGQYEYPKGLFFGGRRLEQGPALLEEFVAKRLARVKRLVVIDVHTGLGPFGVDSLLVEAPLESTTIYDEIRSAFGERVAPLDLEQSVAYPLRNPYCSAFPRVLPSTRAYFVGQEFGTVNVVRALKALREENRWHHYGGGGIDHPTKRDLKEAFAPDNDSWRTTVLQRGKTVFEQAVELAF